MEDRTERFAKRVRAFLKRLPMGIVGNPDDARQLVRASGSVGANYIEANEALGQKDFLMHVRISRKESKESRFFLRLLDTDNNPSLESERAALIQEATELIRVVINPRALRGRGTDIRI